MYYLKELDEWYSSSKEALLLYGSPGSGKTHIANKYLKSKNYTVFNYSILESKHKKSLIELIKDIIKTSVVLSYFDNNVNKYSSIIIDDIDFSLIQKTEIIELLEFKRNNPQYNNKIILITNHKYNLSSIKKYLYILEIKKPKYKELYDVAGDILKPNNKIKNEDIKNIVNKSEGDYRKLIYNCKQYNSSNNISFLNIYKCKDNFDDIYEKTNNLYSNYTKLEDTMNYNESYLIYNMLCENTYDNIINNTTNTNSEKIDILNNIYNTYNYTYNLHKLNEIKDNYIVNYSNQNISYNYNKLKKNSKSNILNYPKIISIYNNKNLFLKTKQIFNKNQIYFKLNNKQYILFIEYLIKYLDKIDLYNINTSSKHNLINILYRYCIINNTKIKNDLII